MKSRTVFVGLVMLNQSLHRFAIATTIAFPLIFSTLPLTTQSAFAKDRDRSLIVENNSGDDIVRVELRRADHDGNRWDAFRQLVQDGDKASYLVSGGRCPVYYDIKVQLANGQSFQEDDVDVCERRVYSVGSRKPQGNQNQNYPGSSSYPNQNPNPGPYPNQNPYPNSNPYPNPGPYPNQNPYPNSNSGPYAPGPAPAAALPSMFDNLNPNQPLPPNVAAGINVAMSGQGLSPAACNTNPVVMITINSRYTACAYPTATYAAGRYQMTLQGL
jgi:hypothetical protein